MSRLLLTLILFALIINHCRADEQRCRIKIDGRSDLAEDCKVTKKKNGIYLDCDPLINQTSTLKLCQDTLVNHVQDRGVCTVSASFSFLEVHGDFLPPEAYTVCGSTITVPSLVINNEKEVETKALTGLFFGARVEFLVQKVKIIKTRLMKNSGTSNLILYLHEPDELELHDFESTMPLELSSRQTKISISNGRFNGLGILNLHEKFERLELKSVIFGKRRIKQGAITLVLGPSECPKVMNVTIRDTFNKDLIENDPIVINDKCLSQDPSEINLDLRENGFWPEIPRKISKKLLKSLLENKRMEFSFAFDSIDCCNAKNDWIFEWAQDESSKLVPKNLNIPCEDLGGIVYNYTLPGAREEACDNLGAGTPMVIIVVVIVICTTIFLLGFSCICIMYVLPKRRFVVGPPIDPKANGPNISSGVVDTPPRTDRLGTNLLGSSGSTGRTVANPAMDKAGTVAGTLNVSGTSLGANARLEPTIKNQIQPVQPN